MIVLASQSPRRRSLMSKITNDFLTYVSDIDEHGSYKLGNYLDIVRDISYRKAKKAKEAYPNEIILAADTIVVFGDEILGKPKDKEDAIRMLKELSNQEHLVITGYTLINKNKELTSHVISRVLFNELSDDLINRYVESGSPLDKAGAYGIQDNKDFPIVKSYEGSYENIVGFPTDEIKKDIENIKK